MCVNLVYIGTPALTSRGFLEADFVKVAEFFDEALKLALKIKAAEPKGRFFDHNCDVTH